MELRLEVDDDDLAIWFDYLKPRNALKLAAGLVGLAFDRLQGLAPARADDLTRISGIGPTYARRLEAAGITTFAQLAAMTPAELKAVLALKEWQGTPAAWIEQAQALVG